MVSTNGVGAGAPAADGNDKVVQDMKAEESQVVAAFLDMVKEDARNGVVACTDRTKKRDGIGNLALRERLGLEKIGSKDTPGEAARADQAIEAAGKALDSLAKIDDHSKTKNELAAIV